MDRAMLSLRNVVSRPWVRKKAALVKGACVCFMIFMVSRVKIVGVMTIPVMAPDNQYWLLT